MTIGNYTTFESISNPALRISGKVVGINRGTIKLETDAGTRYLNADLFRERR